MRKPSAVLVALFITAAGARGQWQIVSGNTETSATAVSNFGEDYKRKPASCGVPAPTGEAKIMDPDGKKELPIGEVGELCGNVLQAGAGSRCRRNLFPATINRNGAGYGRGRGAGSAGD